MLCQACGQHPATAHIKTVINGQLKEAHLCAECAAKQGYGGLLGGWGDFGSLLGGLLGQTPPAEEKRCPGCGSSFREISKSGKAGCGQCYETFRSQFLPVIQRVHGTLRHTGKVPGGSALRVQEENRQLAQRPEPSPLEEKRRQLREAVEAQNFEEAAVLRDQIKEMEKNE